MMSREEMEHIGMTEEQINAVFNQIRQNDFNTTLEKRNIVPIRTAYTDADITTIDQIREYNKGKIIELPAFSDGQPFIAKVRRPSMLVLVKQGKIPNSLLNQATHLFKEGAGALGNDNTINDLYDIMETICESALVSPSYSEIKNAGLTLNDQQMMAIFSYTQQGVKALESFRE